LKYLVVNNVTSFNDEYEIPGIGAVTIIEKENDFFQIDLILAETYLYSNRFSVNIFKNIIIKHELNCILEFPCIINIHLTKLYQIINEYMETFNVIELTLVSSLDNTNTIIPLKGYIYGKRINQYLTVINDDIHIQNYFIPIIELIDILRMIVLSSKQQKPVTMFKEWPIYNLGNELIKIGCRTFFKTQLYNVFNILNEYKTKFNFI